MRVAFIPVRGGSKSIPLKNIKPIAGRPLLYWVLDAAVKCDFLDKVLVCTDDARIQATAEAYGHEKVQVIGRSAEASSDTASTESVMIEALNNHPEITDFILIQATSPLLSTQDLQNGWQIYQDSHDSVLSVVRQHRFLWKDDKNGAISVNYDYNTRPRRQDWNGELVENGAFYISNRRQILDSNNRLSGKIGLCEMDAETYFEIDEPSDWLIVEQLLYRRPQAPAKPNNHIKMLLTDVDGVLTDGSMYYTEHGDEIKRFHTYDGKAVELLRKQGIICGILTAEDTQMVARRGKKIKMDIIHQGVKDKLSLAKQIAAEYNIELKNMAYVGDDVNDVALLAQVGLSFCPSNAQPEVRALSNVIPLDVQGGYGVLRKILPWII